MGRERLRKALIRDEGERLEAYQDTVDLWTIGVGHLLGTEKRMSRITQAESRALLEADIDEAIVRIFPLLHDFLGAGYEINDARYRAVVNMSFNLGNRLGGFKKFLGAMNAGAYELAAKEMMDSKWAKQVGARAERLRDMVLTNNEA